eukprot:scaffold26810_cov142-Skeletonema_marinoi.AAC.8
MGTIPYNLGLDQHCIDIDDAVVVHLRRNPICEQAALLLHHGKRSHNDELHNKITTTYLHNDHAIQYLVRAIEYNSST